MGIDHGRRISCRGRFFGRADVSAQGSAMKKLEMKNRIDIIRYAIANVWSEDN
jgi:hypothetical protein